MATCQHSPRPWWPRTSSEEHSQRDAAASETHHGPTTVTSTDTETNTHTHTHTYIHTYMHTYMHWWHDPTSGRALTVVDIILMIHDAGVEDSIVIHRWTALYDVAKELEVSAMDHPPSLK